MSDTTSETTQAPPPAAEAPRRGRKAGVRYTSARKAAKAAQAPSERPALRPPVRDDDPRAAAERRAAEIMGHLGNLDEGADEFYFDPANVPAGWSYEWKRRTVYNQEDPAYQVALARTGWEPVPAARHPEMMPRGGKHQTIERKGQVLMMRPKVITDQFKAIDKKAAAAQMRAKEAQLGMAPEGHFDRTSDPRTRPQVNKSYEPLAIPAD